MHVKRKIVVSTQFLLFVNSTQITYRGHDSNSGCSSSSNIVMAALVVVLNDGS